MFETFTISGIKFISIPNESGYHIMSNDGTNYGRWMNLNGSRGFKERFKSEGVKLNLGKSIIQIIPAR